MSSSSAGVLSGSTSTGTGSFIAGPATGRGGGGGGGGGGGAGGLSSSVGSSSSGRAKRVPAQSSSRRSELGKRFSKFSAATRSANLIYRDAVCRVNFTLASNHLTQPPCRLPPVTCSFFFNNR